MGSQDVGVERLIALRKLTRAVSDLLHARLLGYLSTLAPLLRPRTVLGEYVQGATKEYAKNADRAFKDLQALYETLAPAKPFSLRTALSSPLHLDSGPLELTPYEYEYVATDGDVSRQVTVRTPLNWVLGYAGYSPTRLRELLAASHRSAEQSYDLLVHFLVMHTVLNAQPGVVDLLRALHFHVTVGRIEEFGELPVVEVATSVGTIRPSDAVIIRSAELSGMDAFEEVIDLDALGGFRDPLREELLELASRHGQPPDARAAR